MNDLKFAAPCLFGIESVVADELRRMDIKDVNAENGRVLFSGDFNTLARANINSRFAERILIVVGEFNAESFTELYDNVKKTSLGRFYRSRRRFPRNGKQYQFCTSQYTRLSVDIQKGNS